MIQVCGVGGYPGGTLGAVDTQQYGVAIDVLSERGIVGDCPRLNKGFDGLPRLFVEPTNPAAIVEDRKSGSLNRLFAAKDVPQGILAIAVAPVVGFIISFEIEGAGFLLVTVADVGRECGLLGRFLLPGAKMVGRRGRGAGIVAQPIAVAVPVVNAVRVKPARVIVRSSSSSRPTSKGWGVEAAMQEFPCGGQAVVGLEGLEVALHHVHQKSDGGAAVVSLFADQGGEILVERVGISRVSRRLRGTTPGRLGCRRIGGDEGMGRSKSNIEELAGSVETMARFGTFQAALHKIDKEADNEPAVVSLLPDDVREGQG